MIRILALLLALTAPPALADAPQVLGAVASAEGAGWRFDVTLAHPDTGWDHYADAWRAEAPDGTILGQRDLAHPHQDEQPFTRSLSGIAVPQGLDHVLIRSHCLTDGWSAETFRLNLN